jgi:hypothetical protein
MLMLRRLAIVSVLVSGTVCLSACDEKLSSLAGPTPNLQPSFSSIQREIFESTDSSGRSACTSCHSDTGRTPSGGLNLNHAVAYEQLVNRPVNEKAGATRVIPNDSASSYLLQKLMGAATITGRRMPFNGPPYLSDGQIQIIQRWIDTGAPNN